MLKSMFQKLTTLESHHQVLFAVLVLVAIVLFSWGVEKIFEDYIFPRKYPLFAYVLAIVLGIGLFLLTRTVLLQVL